MKLAFLDCQVLFTWTLGQVSRRVKRGLSPAFETRVRQVETALDLYHGLQPACSINDACGVVTQLYKSGDLPLVGDITGFPVRKSLAREAAQCLRGRVHFLSPGLEHFVRAEQLWLKLCCRESEEGYAQFADYVDAALLLTPPSGLTIPVALLGHAHVHYILRKERATTLSWVIA